MYFKYYKWIELWFVVLVFWLFSFWSCFSTPWGLLALAASSLLLVASTISLVYWGLAPLNICFTFVSEGTAKIVIVGNKFSRALIQWEGRTLDKEWNVVREDRRRKEPRHIFGGLRFYGFWPFRDIMGYDFSWTGVAEDGQPRPHIKETLDYILLKEDVYWAKIEKAEDEDMLPLDIEALLTIRVINPYKALFEVQNWLEAVINRIKPLVRDRITQSTYEVLIKDNPAIGAEIFQAARKLRSEFKRMYGVDLRKIEVKDIDPPDDWRETTMLEYKAEQEKKAVVVGAEAEAKKIVIEAEAEAERVKKVNEAVQSYGDLGKQIRVLEAMEKSPGQGAKWIVLPGITDIVSRIFPGKSPEALTPEELDKLKQLLKSADEE